jgi:hypothetical protein
MALSKKDSELYHAVLWALVKRKGSFPFETLNKDLNYAYPMERLQKALDYLCMDGAVRNQGKRGANSYFVTVRGKELYRREYYSDPEKHPGLHSEHYLTQKAIADIIADNTPPIPLFDGDVIKQTLNRRAETKGREEREQLVKAIAETKAAPVAPSVEKPKNDIQIHILHSTEQAQKKPMLNEPVKKSTYLTRERIYDWIAGLVFTIIAAAIVWWLGMS